MKRIQIAPLKRRPWKEPVCPALWHRCCWVARPASLLLGSPAGFAVVGALLLGWMIDRFHLWAVICLQFGLVIGILSLLAASQTPNLPLLIAHALVF